jgi:SRSO17 transposase
MSDPIDTASEQRLQQYLSRLTAVLGHADRKARLVGYCTGLLLPGERKSVEPMAARLDPAQVPSLHQALHHFVATAAWRDEAVLATVREQVLPALTRHGPVMAWIIDDTSFPKKGRHSVGVTRQYCGQLGKQENCQVAVSLSVANDWASLPIAFELYLPEDWAGDPARRSKAGVPALRLRLLRQGRPEVEAGPLAGRVPPLPLRRHRRVPLRRLTRLRQPARPRRLPGGSGLGPGPRPLGGARARRRGVPPAPGHGP